MLATLFLSGDVMIGRGIDQILVEPCNPHLAESYIKDARGYVELAEQVNGRISRGVEPSYIWGDAISEFEFMKPDVKIINLETAITTSEEWVHKGINYRMNPKNISCLTAAEIDCCTLANNHTLDWGELGLRETLNTLKSVNIRTSGAGENISQAEAPAILEFPKGFRDQEKNRVLIFSFGMESSGVPSSWRATQSHPGVNFLSDFSSQSLTRIQEQVSHVKRPGDIVVLSIHWGANWGFEISSQEIQFAHRLIDEAKVDLVQGHSSHHPKALEVYQGKLILYGCGDLINDYEGIGGYEEFRNDLGFMYFVTLESKTGMLIRLTLTPVEIKKFQIRRANHSDSKWLLRVLNREGSKFKVRLIRDENNRFVLES